MKRMVTLLWLCMIAGYSMAGNKKIALIIGITGQDGAYLSRLLLSKNYIVHGMKRRSSSINTDRLNSIFQETIHKSHDNRNFILHYGDVTDTSNVIRLLQEIQPDEVYNLAAQSHVKVSFDLPEYTANTDAIGTLRILEAIRILGLSHKTKFYQASTSELFGKVQTIPQNEQTPFYPRSPYAVAKLYAHWITKNYRESYGIFACSGILFNHESPLRGETFVTRKIVQAAIRIKEGKQSMLYLGNLDACRDWGHARDYVEAMWLMLQQSEPDDFVIGSGKMYSVREFAHMVFHELGISIVWKGSGLDEIGYDKETGTPLIAVDERYFRPAEVELLIADATKARTILGWQPRTTVQELIREMIAYEYDPTHIVYIRPSIQQQVAEIQKEGI